MTIPHRHRFERMHLALICVAGWSCSATETRGPLAELVLTPYVGRLVTVAAVAQHDTVSFLLDTGGGETLITPTLAARLGCTPSGRSVGFRMSGERVEFALCSSVTLTLGGHDFSHSDIAVFDIASLLPGDWPPVAGVIALDTFADHGITLDLANARLILESEASLRTRVRHMAAVSSRFASGTDGRSVTAFLHMEAPAPGWYLFDSANLDVVRVSSHLVDSIPAGHADGIAEGMLQVTGLPAVDGKWRGADIIYDGALSEEFMRAWVFTLDMRAQKVWAVRAASG